MDNSYLDMGKQFPPGNPYLCSDTRETFRKALWQSAYSTRDKVLYSLSLFGWTGEKRPEAQSVLRDMERCGCYLFPAARIFLERFAGVEVCYDRRDPFYFTWAFDRDDAAFCEALQRFKEELLVPVGNRGDMHLFLGESGRVHYWGCDQTGAYPADLFTVLAYEVFGLTDLWRATTPEEREQVLWYDAPLIDRIAEEMEQGTYIPYARRRFARQGGTPDPMTGADPFTQWLLTL